MLSEAGNMQLETVKKQCCGMQGIGHRGLLSWNFPEPTHALGFWSGEIWEMVAGSQSTQAKEAINSQVGSRKVPFPPYLSVHSHL